MILSGQCYVRQEGKAFTPESALFLAVETAVVAAPLALGGSGGVRQDANFESVPVGQTRIRTITIMSKSDEPLELTAEARQTTIERSDSGSPALTHDGPPLREPLLTPSCDPPLAHRSLSLF